MTVQADFMWDDLIHLSATRLLEMWLSINDFTSGSKTTALSEVKEQKGSETVFF